VQQGKHEAQKIFTLFFETLTAWNQDLRGIESLCLGSPHGAPEVQGRDWRFDMIHGTSKLERFWKTMGGITPLPDDPHRLFFLKFKDAMDLVSSEEAHGLYGHLHRSIYSASEEQQLKATIAALSTKGT